MQLKMECDKKHFRHLFRYFICFTALIRKNGCRI